MMTMEMELQNKLGELSKESQELNRQLENLQFLKEHNLTSLLDVANELENKFDVLKGVIEAAINNQVEKNPKEMDEREREIWFTSTLSRMIRMNNLLGGMISEIDKIPK